MLKLEAILERIRDSILQGTQDYEELILRYKFQYNRALGKMQNVDRQFVQAYNPENGRRYVETMHPVI